MAIKNDDVIEVKKLDLQVLFSEQKLARPYLIVHDRPYQATGLTSVTRTALSAPAVK